MTITSKSTKAQLLQYIEELEACQAVADQMVLDMEAQLRAERPSLQDRATVVIEELKSFCIDVYRLGAWCRKVSQPVLDKAILIVNT